MPEPSAVVMITKPRGKGVVDSEVPVHSLDELYRACRDALIRGGWDGAKGAVTYGDTRP